jgi:ankyrin repeat protein
LSPRFSFHQVEVNQRDVMGFSPLWVACSCGRVEVARLLLTEGQADVRLRDKSGRTALQVARERHNTACVALLEVRSVE